ncbi:serine carboxypeptidase-like 26 isoform X2 [Panicum virgatum]|uniref:serine carboxypeptidase-like 26 isoform X2 n=1 Tax=Panicum virgatum TaxID=38727 RepID=UPI0019D5DA23|nr:serine carboxypeptidase-like 26 isoform X2 [Panicum virgatum]
MAAAGLLCLCLVSALAFSSCSLSLASNQRDADRVARLPGQPESPSVSQFAGYVTVNERHGRALFYWFFEAQTTPEEKPLLLWLNGGPGCSSIGYGAASELGPLRVDSQGAELKFNEYGWNKEANLLFLESPVGVGFSYTNKSSDLDNLNDVFVAEDSYSFLVNWLQQFPEYKDREFYIAGESYAGHYVPQLAELVYERNKDKKEKSYINLKGFIVGNPITNDYHDSKGLAEYAWSHAVVPDEVYSRIKKYCDFKNSNWSDDCSTAMDVIYSQYREIDKYNIYAPKCLLNQTSASSTTRAFFENDHFRRRIRMFSGYDPCYSSYAENYFNKGEVQRAFHANVSGLLSGKWQVCSDPILNSYNFSVFSVLPIYSKLIKAGHRVWLYSGDADVRVPVIGSRYCVEALDLPIKTQWQPWYLDKQVAGRFVEYHGMSMVTVRGAGHLVPLNKPAEGLTLINAFLRGPGCFSIGYGAASELGPLRITRQGAALKFNEYAWNKEANLLFLESPVGAGFSYTNTSSDLDKLNDDFVAEDAYSFIVNWLQRFPEYKDREFYIAGESYAGHYVPQLVDLVSERNKEKKGKTYINIKGFIVGNPVTDDYYDSKGLAEYAWSHAVVSDEVYSRIKKHCDFKISNWSDDCNAAMDIVYGQYQEIDMYNIYAPKCLLNQSSASSANRAFFVNDQFRGRIRMLSGYDPCYSSYPEVYFNKQEVQKAFHANFSGLLPGKWHACSDLIQNSYNFSVFSVLPIYSKLIKAGLRVWLYRWLGPSDRLPVLRRSTWPADQDPVATLVPRQTGCWEPGRFVEYHGLSMVTVRGAGHLVPLNKPAEALTLINAFLRGEQLPTHR